MQKTLKPVLSILVIGFFLLITLATNFEDILIESTNTTVKVKNCEMKPEVSDVLRVTIILKNEDGTPLGFYQGKLFVTHQKIQPDSCTFDVVFNQTIPFSANSEGVFVFEGPQWIHDNSQDLWRVEVKTQGTEFYSAFKELQVKYYDQSNFVISGTLYRT